MDLPDDTTPRTAPTPSFDVNEDDVNEDALFDAPPEPDDTTEFHDAHPIVEADTLPPTPTQGESITSPLTLPQSTLSLEDRVAHFTDLFGDIKEELLRILKRTFATRKHKPRSTKPNLPTSSRRRRNKTLTIKTC